MYTVLHTVTVALIGRKYVYTSYGIINYNYTHHLIPFMLMNNYDNYTMQTRLGRVAVEPTPQDSKASVVQRLQPQSQPTPSPATPPPQDGGMYMLFHVFPSYILD